MLLDSIFFIFDFFEDVMSLLSRYQWEVGGMLISLLDILIGALITSIVITVFWKGARG